MTGRRPGAARVPAGAPAPGGRGLQLVPAPQRLLRELLGERLRQARHARGRTLREVAGVAGVSIGHLSQVERGLAEASSEVLDAVCRALGLPLAALLRAVVVDLTVPLAHRTAPPAPRSAAAPPSAGGPELQARAA